MYSPLIIVSNNPLVFSLWNERIPVRYVEGGALAVLLTVRDLCHRGCRLLSHPLAGSVKPNETPYRSVMLSEAGPGTDPDSVELTEKAIEVTERFGPVRRVWQEREIRDFQLVDEALLAGALESAENDLSNLI